MQLGHYHLPRAMVIKCGFNVHVHVFMHLIPASREPVCVWTTDAGGFRQVPRGVRVFTHISYRGPSAILFPRLLCVCVSTSSALSEHVHSSLCFFSYL